MKDKIWRNKRNERLINKKQVNKKNYKNAILMAC